MRSLIPCSLLLVSLALLGCDAAPSAPPPIDRPAKAIDANTPGVKVDVEPGRGVDVEARRACMSTRGRIESKCCLASSMKARHLYDGRMTEYYRHRFSCRAGRVSIKAFADWRRLVVRRWRPNVGDAAGKTLDQHGSV